MDKEETVSKLKREVAALRRKVAELEGPTSGEGAVRVATGDRRSKEPLPGGKSFAENLMENTAVAAFVLSPEHKILLWNKACEELTGVPSSQMIGSDDHWKPFYGKRRQCLADVVIDRAFENLPMLYEKHRRSPLLPHGLQAEGWYRNMNGKDRYIIFDAAPVCDTRGELVVVIETLQDITESRLREEELKKYRDRLKELVAERTSELVSANERLQREIAERKRMQEDLIRTEKLESLGVLAGGIAHDFNNLLSAVLGNISLAKRYVKPEDKIYGLLEEAERASSRAGDLAQQLLTFSKEGAPVKKVASLPGLVRESAEFALKGSSTRCEFLVPEDLWKVEVDEGQICQVINNIVLNAEQAMPSGGTIRVECSNVRLGPADLPGIRGGRYVRIDIKDSGCGIAEEHVEKIFDPYFTTKQGGSGLGLATAYSIIGKHDGAVTVDSTPGKGTIFHIYLPAYAGNAEKASSDTAEPERKLYTGCGRILVLDDEEIIRMIVESMLREIGYEPSFAEDGQTAIREYAEAKEEGRPFDAVILDLTIKGGMGGMECMRNLLRIDPDVRGIVSSGYAEDPIMSNYRDYGFRDIITKPYQIEELSEILFRVLNRE